MKGSEGFPLTKPMAVNTGLRNCTACDVMQLDEVPGHKYDKAIHTCKMTN